MATSRTDPLRQAVAAGDFAMVLRLWDEYAASILEEIGRGVCTQARMAEAGEFLEWARRVVLCNRAQAQNQLNTIHAARQYGSSPTPPPSQVRASL
jgi:hypothetical protein